MDKRSYRQRNLDGECGRARAHCGEPEWINNLNGIKYCKSCVCAFAVGAPTLRNWEHNETGLQILDTKEGVFVVQDGERTQRASVRGVIRWLGKK